MRGGDALEVGILKWRGLLAIECLFCLERERRGGEWRGRMGREEGRRESEGKRTLLLIPLTATPLHLFITSSLPVSSSYVRRVVVLYCTVLYSSNSRRTAARGKGMFLLLSSPACNGASSQPKCYPGY